MQFRKIKSINNKDFCRDVESSPIVQDLAAFSSVEELTDHYEHTMKSILDTHAPLRKKVVTMRPHSTWYSQEVHQLRMEKRRLERRWRASKLQVDRQIYVNHCKLTNDAIIKSKMAFYTALIDDHKDDQKVLFNTVSKMLYSQPKKNYPLSEPADQLANDFLDFFHHKIANIRNEIPVTTEDPVQTMCENTLTEFQPISEDDLLKLINKISKKSCDIDPVPASILKHCMPKLIPTLTKIVNLSLASSIMPSSLKIAQLNPQLKKQSLNHEEFQNFRPISNLKFVSKAIEKTVAIQMNDHINNHNMGEMFQSAYKVNHSTETALVKVYDDILRSLDQHKTVILLLLDLSAAFDTVDHGILLRRLSTKFGITGKAHEWFVSYLSGRRQFVRVDGAVSRSTQNVEYGVPQGSVLGPLLFTLYTAPLADIMRKHDMCFHLYADDTQIYLSFESNAASLAKCKVEECVREIDMWMRNNLLKLNRKKTELIIISKNRHEQLVDSINFCDTMIEPSQSARNIGVIINSTISMEDHIKCVTKSAYYHLRNISRIRKFLSFQSAEILIHSFITSRLDFCNSLLYGVPLHQLQKLQNVQNAAARLLFASRERDHITPLLKNLHWLPVDFRIKYKIILLTFKCINKLAPPYLQDLVKPYEPTRKLRSSDKNLLAKPKFNLKGYGYKAFSVAAPQLWNNLTDELRDPTLSLSSFKNKLKTFLFKQAFD